MSCTDEQMILAQGIVRKNLVDFAQEQERILNENNIPADVGVTLSVLLTEALGLTLDLAEMGMDAGEKLSRKEMIREVMEAIISGVHE